MKLSEAIRLGAMMSPQAFGHTRSGEKTCALGAALLAIGDTKSNYMGVCNHFQIADREVKDPITGVSMMLVSAIRGLNDHAEWTREQIADYVEQIEHQQEVAQP